MDVSSTVLTDLLTGSGPAWAQFVQASAPVIWGQVRRCFHRYGVVPDPIDLEDVSQDVFYRLTRSDFALLRRFDPTRARLSTYLGVIAHSASVDFLRKRARAGQHAPLDALAEQLASPEASPLARQESALEGVPVGLLSDRQQLILKRLFDDDQEVAEVAIALGVTAQTVRSAKHKALHKIRRYFDGDPTLREAL